MKKKIIYCCLIVLFTTIGVLAQSSSNEKSARDYILQQSTSLQIQPSDQFGLSFVRKGLAGETLRFQHLINNVPVYKSEIVINFDNDNQIAFSSNSFEKNIQNINTTPAISAELAIRTATQNLNLDNNFSFQDCKLLVYNKLAAPKLVYLITTNPNSGVASWESIIDAQTGTILSVQDVALYHHHTKKIKNNILQTNKSQAVAPPFVTGTAMIFNPDPLSQTGSTYGGVYLDNNDATNASFNAARTSVTLPEIDLTNGVYRLQSSYVNILDFETPTTGVFTQSTNAFNFDRANNAFEAVNAFYHLDQSMRYINVTLGVNCRPGLNNGVLLFDSSGLSGADNSHYLPATDRLAFGEGGVDDAEDADVVLHELAHGLHDWMTNGSSSNFIGEGCGDYWAQSFSRSLNQWTTSQDAYHYMFSWDGHNPFWNGRTTNYDAIYPAGLVGQIHADGQIWATALMKIWDVIGRTKTDKVFLEGLALTNSSSNQAQSALALRQAAVNMNYACADIQVMTDKFNEAGYELPNVALRINCPATQTRNVATNGTYTVPSFASLSNAISANCAATVTQSPAVGANLAPGTYPVTMTASSGTSVSCNFSLVVTSALSTAENIKLKNISIYPNPANSILNITGDFDADETISIINTLGQKVLSQKLNSTSEKIDVSKLSKGVYIIVFNSSKATERFIKN